MGCPVRILDSSYLIAFFLEEDFHHVKAIDRAETDSQSAESWIIPDPILFESLSVIRYDQGAPAARKALERLMSNQNIQIYQFNSRERTAIFELFFSSSYSISAADATVAYLCKQMRAPALTYDENLLKVIAQQTLSP